MDSNSPARGDDAIELETVIDARPEVTQAHEENEVVGVASTSGENGTVPSHVHEDGIDYPRGPKLYLSVASLYLALFLSGLVSLFHKDVYLH